MNQSIEDAYKICGGENHEGDRCLPVSSFNKNASNRDGLQRLCTKCRLANRRDESRVVIEIPSFNPDIEKFCKLCTQVKPIDAFPNQKDKPDGKNPNCKDCRNKQKKDRNDFLKQAEENNVEKECVVCKTTKSFTEFGTNKKTKDGFNNSCKDCAKK
jgi:hypothetical protein